MNITSLQTFLAIVETGNLVRASHQLNVTQSTVTARLKTLEDELGQVLLNRYKSGVTLTPAGTKLLRYARIMTGLWQQAKFETSLRKGFNAVCNFGCDRELWHGTGQKFFYLINSDHSDIAMSVQQGSSRDLESWLSAGIVDVILTYETVMRGAQTVYELPPEKLMLYSDQKNAPVTGGPDYVFVDHGAEYRRLHAAAYHDAGIARVSFDSSWWALQYILDYGGAAYLPQALATRFVDQGKIFETQEAPVFSRKKSLVVNDAALQGWDWFPDVVMQIIP